VAATEDYKLPLYASPVPTKMSLQRGVMTV